jgi:hypothetical protein
VLPLIALLASAYAKGQEARDSVRRLHIRPDVQVGVTAGGHLYNGRFIYRTGKALQLGASAAISERIWLGISAGAEKYESELFLPVAVSFTGMLSDKPSSAFLTAQLGYSAGINNKIYSYTGYDYKGGWMMSPGAGYQFGLKRGQAIMLGAGYKHQFASISYTTLDNRVYKESDNFNLIYFRLGFRF